MKKHVVKLVSDYFACDSHDAAVFLEKAKIFEGGPKLINYLKYFGPKTSIYTLIHLVNASWFYPIEMTPTEAAKILKEKYQSGNENFLIRLSSKAPHFVIECVFEKDDSNLTTHSIRIHHDKKDGPMRCEPIRTYTTLTKFVNYHLKTRIPCSFDDCGHMHLLRLKLSKELDLDEVIFDDLIGKNLYDGTHRDERVSIRHLSNGARTYRAKSSELPYHENIAKTYGFSYLHADAYIVYESLIDYTMLKDVIYKLNFPLNPIDILYQVSLGLDHLHKHGAHHGNLNSDVVFITLDGRIILTDMECGTNNDEISQRQMLHITLAEKNKP